MPGETSATMPPNIRSAYAVFMLAVLLLAFLLTGCSQQPDASRTTATAVPKTVAAPKQYVYRDWSDWQLDCTKRPVDSNLPCAAVRKRVCQAVGTQEGVACEHCGGQCREEVADHESVPRHFYAAWSEWQSNCDACDAQPKPCKAERTRTCIDRVAGKATDCEFCGGVCKEQEARVSGCSPECKSTNVYSYTDSTCTVKTPNRDDIFAGPWGPRTGSPFNSGCSETQPTEKCVKFGRHYYQWDRCVPGCAPPPAPQR